MLPDFCPIYGLIFFLRWKKEFGLFKYVQKMIWSFSLQLLNMFIWKSDKWNGCSRGASISPAHFSVLLSFPLSLSPHSPSPTVLSASRYISSVHSDELLYWNFNGTEGDFQLVWFQKFPLFKIKMFFHMKCLKTNFNAEVQEENFSFYGCAI